MSEYSLFCHGNALQIETPDALAEHKYLGWGTRVRFKDPVPEVVGDSPLLVGMDVGPGSWFHLPMPTKLTTFGRPNPRSNPNLTSVTLLFDTSHCRISKVHVYDGAVLISEFNFEHGFPGGGLKGTWDSPSQLKLPEPHRVFAAIGISFFACWHSADFPHIDLRGPFPPAVLTVFGAGGQFLVNEPSLLSTIATGFVDIRAALGGR